MKEEIFELLRTQEITLRPSQGKICLPVVERIYKKMRLKLMFPPISVADGLIIDGHHRYVASLLAKFDVEQTPGIKSNAKIAFDWKSVVLLDEDYDTQFKIDDLNKIDARYNNIALEELFARMAII